ncbi:MAG: hypothetical protein A2941_02050 [Candidatus Yanofskybacteria bacterium RIFCSPLOWO2_01_FULL_49_17]|uniref:DoxX family protein n=1 Tax=Candidatus Yanofskybacteria bacterium RIFCSPLOWO2_01_FULL_49_17 TaxID=1802700 RepID=A0A1F8GV38_9BACT|nr:MAG: hypothetical protein A2941_02050 [Candidatus Yanofskybacteria bacterium RIFCSPLOWO2_01_FULL_49_17]
MWQSLKHSNLFLRLGLVFVFLWFGIDKFFHPVYWLNAWVPASVVGLAGGFDLSANTLVYIFGVFEVLVGISLLANMYVGFFGSLAVLFLAVIPLFQGFNEVLVRDIGLIGGLLSLIFWPRPRFR